MTSSKGEVQLGLTVDTLRPYRIVDLVVHG